MPRHLPDAYSFGDEREAILYVHQFAEAWQVTPGVLAWLRGRIER